MSLSRYTIVFAGVALLPSVVSAQPLTFTRDDRASTSAARGIASADFNRDGWLDIVTAHNNPDGVSVLINRGADGGYTPSFIALPGGPFDVVTGDLNKDGLPDIAVANADANTIDVLLGRAEGGFAAPLNLPGGANPRSLTVADVDRDGNLDLVATQFAGNTVTIHWGDGKGGFGNRTPATLRTGTTPQGVAVADFDIDGRPDIVTVSGGDFNVGVTFHFATANAGAFTRWDVQGTPPLNVVTVGDFDKDGRPDVAAAGTATSDITTLVNTRAGFSIRTFPSGGSSPRGIAAIDLNRDGAPDLVTGNRGTSTVQIALGKGDGTFDAPEPVTAGAGSRAVTVGDFDNDGRVDIASAAEYEESVTVLSNTTAFERSGFAFHWQQLGTANNGFGDADIAVADFDMDGKPDVATHGAGLFVHFGNGTALQHGTVGAVDLAAADVNNDAFPDLIALRGGNSIDVFPGNGAGGFGPVRSTTTELTGREVRVGDLNRDGRPDVVVFGTVGVPPNVAFRLQTFAGDGTGRFTPLAPVPIEPTTADPLLGDVDRDGDLDLVASINGIRGGVTQVLWWPNDGTGAFGSARATAVAEMNGFYGADLGDVNLDGYLDFAAAGSASEFLTYRRVAVLLGGPDGFAAPTYLTTTETILGVVIADINLDGRPDLVGDTGVLFAGAGDGTFAAPELFDFYAPDAVVIDWNRDGLPDVVGGYSIGTAQVVVNVRGDANSTPTVDLGTDQVFQYAGQFGDGEHEFWARTTDPDLHKATYTWRFPDGKIVETGTFPFLTVPLLEPGRHEFVVEANDGRGGTATDSIVVTVLPEKEIVLHVGREFWSEPHGSWQIVNDPTAAGGKALHDVNAGQPKVTTPSAAPAGYVDVSFVATNTETYKLWVRLKADGNSWANDSLWLQFSGAVDANGRSRPAARPASKSISKSAPAAVNRAGAGATRPGVSVTPSAC
jgi:hypothetical protein